MFSERSTVVGAGDSLVEAGRTFGWLWGDASRYNYAEVQGEGVDSLRGGRDLELRALRRYFGIWISGERRWLAVSLERCDLISKEGGHHLGVERIDDDLVAASVKTNPKCLRPNGLLVEGVGKSLTEGWSLKVGGHVLCIIY